MPVELFRSENRYRDVAFDPDGRTIYVITDSSGPRRPSGVAYGTLDRSLCSTMGQRL
jgi:hypothetical protein